jgi:transcriptional regulator with XRE-family HTH domain
MNSMTFADYIKAKRAEKNLSRSEMARRAGFTPQYGMDIERGHVIPTEDKIEALVNVLELDERLAFKLAGKIPLRIYEKAKKEYYGEE